mgnify:CR=1 FL=1|tara:strand:+ start:1608 stop:2234 length:627 start_codon:yes stop_codon:yes gene_type:complete
MAVADEQQTQQNNQVEAGPQYTIYGTNETYTGRVVNVGNRLFTTRGGALEGNSYEVIIPTTTGGNQNTEEDLPTMSPSNQESSPGSSMHSGMGGVSNFFIYSPEFYNHGPYYRTDNGQEVTLYSYLHTHTDGTIMTGRNMSDSGNLILADGSPSPYPTVVPVTLNVPQGGQAGNQNTNQQNQQNNMNNNTGNGGNGGMGGNQGGGGGY